MSQGKLIVKPLGRSVVPNALASHFKLDIETIDKDEFPNFEQKFPLNQVPVFIGRNGFKLTEAIAIIVYLTNLIEDEKTKSVLLGANAEEQAQVLRQLSFTNSELIDTFAKFALILIGKAPFNKKLLDEGVAAFQKRVAVLEDRLSEYTYLATESVTVADLFAAAFFALLFTMVYGKDYTDKHPKLMRWFNTVIAHPILAPFINKSAFLEKSVEAAPPKKEKPAKQAKKETPAPKAAEKPAEQPAEQQKKPKHPLEALGKPTFVLDDWKRKYSNEDTRPVALPWFWDHYNPEEYSIWKVDYKYNDELTLTFMSNNLVGGFFNRLTGSIKYMFGCLVVYGENNNNGIVGAVMVRGQDAVPAFNVAPDWESYEFSKLDPTKEEDKEFINNMWAWDKPVVVNGESREIADGKVLK
ncbi:LAMI_0G02014g1_1 [Lachancea mirantina]|uniref:LAMI_0G02014g1_1 n=1 Tax=Lachancea mirantina TaxID=1230905 RepID=A0A1G4K7M9_9SACH|nr:LAMI_0G02014g1_1 [Lachancea mirantina]